MTDLGKKRLDILVNSKQENCVFHNILLLCFLKFSGFVFEILINIFIKNRTSSPDFFLLGYFKQYESLFWQVKNI